MTMTVYTSHSGYEVYGHYVKWNYSDDGLNNLMYFPYVGENTSTTAVILDQGNAVCLDHLVSPHYLEFRATVNVGSTDLSKLEKMIQIAFYKKSAKNSTAPLKNELQYKYNIEKPQDFLTAGKDNILIVRCDLPNNTFAIYTKVSGGTEKKISNDLALKADIGTDELYLGIGFDINYEFEETSFYPHLYIRNMGLDYQIPGDWTRPKFVIDGNTADNRMAHLGEEAWTRYVLIDGDGNPMPGASFKCETIMKDEDNNLISDESIEDSTGHKFCNKTITYNTTSEGKRRISCTVPTKYKTGVKCRYVLTFEAKNGYYKAVKQGYLFWSTYGTRFIELSELGYDPSVFLGETANAKWRLEKLLSDDTWTPISDASITYWLRIVDDDGNIIIDGDTTHSDSGGVLYANQTTTSLGEHAESYTYNGSVNATGHYILTYKGTNGNSTTYGYGTFRWKKKVRTKTRMLFTETPPSTVKVGQTETIEVKLIDADGYPMRNREVHIYGDITNEGWYTTNGRGVISFKYSPVMGGTAKVNFQFPEEVDAENDVVYAGVTKSLSFTVNKINTKLSLVSSTKSVDEGKANIVKVKLLDEYDKPIKNMDLKLVWTQTTKITTDSNGICTFNPTSADPMTKKVTFAFEGTQTYNPAPTNIEETLTWVNVPDTTLTLTSNVSTQKTNKPVNFTATLKDENGNPLKNKPVFYWVTTEDVSASQYGMTDSPIEDTLTTNNNGVVTLNGWKTHICGTYDFHFVFVGEEHLLERSEASKSIEIVRTPTRIVFEKIVGEDDENPIHVGINGGGKIRVEDTEGNPIPNKHVQVSLTFTYLNQPYTGEAGYTNKDYTTGSDGTVEVYYKPTKKGDIIGKFTFHSTETLTYASSNNSLNRVNWKKIPTVIVPTSIAMYNGRYTALDAKNRENEAYTGEAIDWTSPSLGTDMNPDGTEKKDENGNKITYKNLRAVLKTSSHLMDNYVLADKEVEFIGFDKDGNKETKDTRITHSDGSARGRWTTTLDIIAPYESNMWAKFAGDDVYEYCSNDFTITFLPRKKPTMTKLVEILYGDNIRYNVAFNYGVTLKDGTTPLKDHTVKLTYDDARSGVKENQVIAHSDGECRVNNYEPPVIGKVTITAEYGYIVSGTGEVHDWIDKYETTSFSYKITVDKEDVIFDMETGAEIYHTCYHANVWMRLRDTRTYLDGTDREDERAINGIVTMYYDDGSYNTPHWTKVEDDPEIQFGKIDGISGRGVYVADAYSGLRRIGGAYHGDEYYNPASATCFTHYEIERTYTANLKSDGTAVIEVDCIAHPENGLPLGLYDLELEYIPPSEDGDCPRYTSDTSLFPVRKKISTELVKTSTVSEIEAFDPAFVIVRLQNSKGKGIAGEKIISTVNYGDRSVPAHVTGDTGLVRRGSFGKYPGETLMFRFEFEQSRVMTGAILEVPISVTKMTPHLTVKETKITNYKGEPYPLQATLVHTRYKISRFGYEVKLAENGHEIYYNPLLDEYYQTYDGRIICTENDYNKASHIPTTAHLWDKLITWRGKSGVTELVSARTNSNGVAHATLTRNTTGDTYFFATSAEDEEYFGASVRIDMTTLPMIEPYFENIKWKPHVYHYPILLYTHLYLPGGVPFTKQPVKFRHGEVKIGEGVTLHDEEIVDLDDGNGTKVQNAGLARMQLKDANGNTLWEDTNHEHLQKFVIPNAEEYEYNVVFERRDEYALVSKSYSIPISKQTPVVELKMYRNGVLVNPNDSTTVPTLHETVELRATLRENSNSGVKDPKNSSLGATIAGGKIHFYEKTDIIHSEQTDDNGVAKATFKLHYGWDGEFTAVFNPEDSKRFNGTSDKFTTHVNRLDTHFVHKSANPIILDHNSSGTIWLTLLDSNDDPVSQKNIWTTSTKSPSRSLMTNNNGNIFYVTEAKEGGLTEQVKFSFNSTKDDDPDYEWAETTVNVKWRLQTHFEAQSADPMLLDNNSTGTIWLTLLDSKGNPVRQKDITTTSTQSPSRSVMTNNNGNLFYVTESRPSGSSEKVTFKFDSDDDYMGTSITMTVKWG